MNKKGKYLVGMGMATATYPATRSTASAKVQIFANGAVKVFSATQDIGTGTYTVMTQIAAEVMGLPLEAVEFKLGDSDLPQSPVEGGSWTVSSNGSAVKLVCEAIKKEVFKLTRKMDDSPFADAEYDTVIFEDGKIKSKTDASKSVSIFEAMRRKKIKSIEEETASMPDKLRQSKYTTNSHSAVFAEVKVDEDLGTIHVTRVVSAIAGGRVINPKTARSQIMGAVVWGIGQALHEESIVDQNFGRFINHNLAEYHVPVCADVPEITVIFVEEKDDIVNPLGAKGLGEIGIVGVAAAIGNAIYHATGKRVRDLPITIDKLL